MQIITVLFMEKLKPEKLVEMLKAKGIDVPPEEAILLTDFLRRLAHIVVEGFIDKHNRKSDEGKKSPNQNR